MIMRAVLLVLLAALGLPHIAKAEETVKIGTIRSVTNSSILIGIERGWFKEFDINVEFEYLQSSSTGMASLAQGQLNIIAGGISAGYFNALEKNLPITITVDRATTPIGH